jgi:hypothetical protein
VTPSESSLILAALAAVGVVLSAATLRWHLRAGRVVTMFAVYITILTLEFGGGLIPAFINQNPTEFDDSIAAVIIRLASLVPFCCGYFLVAASLRWPDGPSAARSISSTLRLVVTARTRQILLGLWGLLAAATLYPLFVKIQIAGGISSYFEIFYQMRFGTYGESVLENTAVVAAGILAGPLLAVTALIAMDAASGATKPRSAMTLLVAATAFNIIAGAAQGRRMAIAVALAVPLAAWHFQRPFGRTAVFRLCTLLVVAAIVANWMHYYLYAATAGWDRRSLGETTMALLAPHEHLKTLTTIVAAAEVQEALGVRQLALSAVSLLPRAIWQGKPSHELLGSLAIQDWAGLPTHYQLAVTDVGEAIACLGYVGIATLTIMGALYALLDYSLFTSAAGRAVVIGVCLARVLSDQGMGVAALSQSVITTILTLAMFTVILPSGCVLAQRSSRRKHPAPSFFPKQTL